MDYPGQPGAQSAGPTGKPSMGAPATEPAEEAPVKEITLCVYQDGSYAVKDGESHEKVASLEEAVSLVQSKAAGESPEQAQMGGFKEGFKDSPAGGGMGAMV